MSRNVYDTNASGAVDTVKAFSWVSLTNKPTAFPPIIPHNVDGLMGSSHYINEIVGLQTALATFVTTTTLPTVLSTLTYTTVQIDAFLATKAPVIHFHDDRYYQKAYVDGVTSPSGIDSSLAVYEQTQTLQHQHDDRYYGKAYIDNVLNVSNFSLVNDARYYTKAETDQEISNAPFLTQPEAVAQFYTQNQIDMKLAVLGNGLFVYNQTTPANVWNLAHNLGCYPNVDIIVSGELALAKVVYPDVNHVTVYFSQVQTGSLYLT